MASACNIVVIGGSAGGVESVVNLVRALRPDIPAAIFIVVHFPTTSTSYLPQILSRQNKLPAVHPYEGQPIELGHIYVAPPDFHLVVRQNEIALTHSARINSHRPAIDPLFFSAARAFGPRAVGVILSGMQDDGVAGLRAIKAAGGVAIVQDPAEALFTSMPVSAIENVAVDYILPLTQIAATLSQLASAPEIAAENGQELEASMDPEEENEYVQEDIAGYEQGEKGNGRTTLTCPGCGGVLWELREGDLLNFRCHVGHVYSSESMLSEQAEQLESALWVAVRALEERAMLLRRMANSAQQRQNLRSRDRFIRQADAVEANGALIREKLLTHHDAGPIAGLTADRQHPAPRAKSPTDD